VSLLVSVVSRPSVASATPNRVSLFDTRATHGLLIGARYVAFREGGRKQGPLLGRLATQI
jgi:hypothetical protein